MTLIRILPEHMPDDVCTFDQSRGQPCEERPVYGLATPLGEFPVCQAHIGEAIASLPTDFLGQWQRCPAEVFRDDDGDIPF